MSAGCLATFLMCMAGYYLRLDQRCAVVRYLLPRWLLEGWGAPSSSSLYQAVDAESQLKIKGSANGSRRMVEQDDEQETVLLRMQGDVVVDTLVQDSTSWFEVAHIDWDATAHI